MLTRFTAVLLFVVAFFPLIVTAASPWDETNVPTNKIWTIEFNTKMKESTINRNNIYVTNEHGDTLSTIDVSLSDDQSFVRVSNSSPYNKGETYRLVITQNVKSDAGINLKEPIEMVFTTRKDTINNSRTAPATIGEPFVIGSGAVSYELELTELLSGEDAWQKAYEASPYNEPPGAGKEYIFAKFKVKLLTAERSKYFSYHDFTIVSKQGNELKRPVLYRMEDRFAKDLEAGDEFEGWIFTEVDKTDNAPLLQYEDHLTDLKADLWFKLRKE
ncbi:Ig-like domain-containing protein [Bacillus tianshenii]|nr:Ig-like domain-containing protein [Bacillus tianshenii]